MQSWLEVLTRESRLRRPLLAAQPRLRARGPSLVDARHWRHLRHLQRCLRGAHRPVPIRQAGRNLGAGGTPREGRGGHTYTVDEVRSLREVPAFADVMTTSIETVLMTGEFAPESFGGVLLSGNAFNFLGVPPVIGRTIQPSDIRPDGEVEPVVVLSFRLWQRLFESSPTALGRTLQLNGRPHTIVGVMPPRFGWYGNNGFWLPLSMKRTDLPGPIPSSGSSRVFPVRSPRNSSALFTFSSPRRSRRRSRRKASRRRCATISTSPSPVVRCSRACSCCSAPSRSCFSSRAPTSQICSWRAGQPERERWPSGCRLAPDASGCCVSC